MQLIAEKLIIERGGRTILHDVSFTATAGATLLLTGPNGAGKTTLLRALAGFLPLSGGVIRLSPDEDDAPRAERIHAVGHSNAVKAHLTVRENVLFWAQFLGGKPLYSTILQRTLAKQEAEQAAKAQQAPRENT